MSSDEDRIFFYNYTIIIGLLAVMILIFFVLARYFGMDEEMIALARADRVAMETMPVGSVRLAGEEPEEPPVSAMIAAADAGPVDMGQQVYEGLCISCHNGLAGIPKVGDKVAWESRIAQGMALLYEHAIKGFQGEGSLMAMPAKGGNMSLTDEEVKAAVDYMVALSQ